MTASAQEPDGTQRREIARILVGERSRLRQELNLMLSKRFCDLEQTDERRAIDPDSWHDDELITLTQRLHVDIAAAEDALDRLRREVFGICVDCGEDIAAVQLRVEPTRARCAECAIAHTQARGSAAETEDRFGIY